MRDILKATVRYRENSFFFGKLLFVTLTSCNSNGHYAIALKFTGEQINLIKKKIGMRASKKRPDFKKR